MFSLRRLALFLFLCLGSSNIALAESDPQTIESQDGFTEDYGCQQSYNRGYAKGKEDWYKKGYWKGYEIGRSEYDCSAKRSEGYNQGYADGIKHKGGYDGGYKEGHKTGYDDGYKAGNKDGYDRGVSNGSGGGAGLCAFIFKFDGFINSSELQCTASDQCEDSNENTIDVCLFKTS